MTTRRAAAALAPRYPALAAASSTPGPGLRWNPRAVGAPSHRECGRCRRPAPRSGRSSTAIRRCAPTSDHHHLLLLLLLLLLLTRAAHRPQPLRLLLLLLLSRSVGPVLGLRALRRSRERPHHLGSGELTVGHRRARRQHPGVLGPAALTGVDHQ